ncbi:MAG TPA: hypothetical protein VIM73_03785 [Polyangiaceae bacterium]
MKAPLRAAWVSMLCAALAGCGEGDKSTAVPSGELELYASGKRCPIISAYTANPAVAGVGERVSLTAAAMGSGNPRALSFLWLASAGTFSDSSAAMTQYTCDQAGVQTLTLVMSDGTCVDYAKLPIDCVAVGR